MKTTLPLKNRLPVRAKPGERRRKANHAAPPAADNASAFQCTPVPGADTEHDDQDLGRATRKRIFREICALDDELFRERIADLLAAERYTELNFSLLRRGQQKALLEELADPHVAGLKLLEMNLSSALVPLGDILETLKTTSRHNPLMQIRIRLTAARIDTMHAAAIAASMQEVRITHLHLSDNLLGNAGTHAIFNALCESSVTHLSLDCNGIDHLGTAGMAEALACSKVECLDLSRNWMGDPGAISIARVLPRSRLHTLTLCFSRIGHEGAIALADALAQASLLRLDLRGNDIGDRGAAAFANALLHSRLLRLGLRENSIGDAGALALSERLRMSSLAGLDLRGNNIGAAGKTAIQEVQASIRGIRILE